MNAASELEADLTFSLSTHARDNDPAWSLPQAPVGIANDSFQLE
jgi:hypothetical protein